MFFRPNIPPKQEGYSRNNDTFLKIEGFWRDKKSPKTLDVMLVFGHGASGDTELFENNRSTMASTAMAHMLRKDKYIV